MATRRRRTPTCLTVTVTPLTPSVNPLRAAASLAKVSALALSGSHTTPARAPASAAFWRLETRLYQ